MRRLHKNADFDLHYLDRADWGANGAYPRKGETVPRSTRTSATIHHTTAIDTSDATPNTWELSHALGYQRKLQTIRPDLGYDVPYSFVFYLAEDGKTVWVMEGRGYDRSAAHSKGYNVTGIGLCFGGNFTKRTKGNAQLRGLKAAEWFLSNMRHELGFVNLGDDRPSDGREVYGHKDIREDPTTCPGGYLYNSLDTIRFMEAPTQESDDMPLAPMYLNDGTPEGREEKGSDVAILQSLLNDAYTGWEGYVPVAEDGNYGPVLAATLAQWVHGGAEPGGTGVAGGFLTGKAYANVQKAATIAEATKIAATIPKGDRGLTGQPGNRGPMGPAGKEGPAGPAGPTGKDAQFPKEFTAQMIVTE